jgi:ferredoxin-NADP reductase
MLDHLAATGSSRPVRVLHADRTPADHALRADTRRLLEQLPDAREEFWYEQDATEERWWRVHAQLCMSPAQPQECPTGRTHSTTSRWR